MIIYHKIRPHFPNFGNHAPKNKCLQNNLALIEDGKIGRWGDKKTNIERRTSNIEW